MGFRGFSPETLEELHAIQKKIDEGKCGCERGIYCACLSGTRHCCPGQCQCAERSDAIRQLERDRGAIYQADYDLSRQHRGY